MSATVVSSSEVGGGWQMVTRLQYAPVRRVPIEDPLPWLSRAGLETLAIVAYRQPITRAEAGANPGVDCGGRSRRSWSADSCGCWPHGRGRTADHMWTTRSFLQYFGLNDLSQMPSLKEFQDMADAELP